MESIDRMTAEQRAELYQQYRDRMASDADKRDSGWAEAMAAWQRIAELAAENKRLKAALAVYEDHTEEGFTP